MRRTARGAAWTILSSVGGRAVGLISTLVLTRYLSPDEYGAVSVAAVIVMSLSELTEFGLLQYAIAKPDCGPDAVFHATSYNLVIGIIVLLTVVLLARPLAALFDAPAASVYIAGLALSQVFGRIAMPPERILFRDLRFAEIELWRAVSEFVYAGLSIALAIVGFGGFAIVYANIGQWGLFAIALIWIADIREWGRPCRMSWHHTRAVWSFGLPLTVARGADIAASNWDNLLIARFFGTRTVGIYALAKNLAAIPAVHVGEQIADVLLPSFARMGAERRRTDGLTACAVLALIVSPLAIGLGVVAHSLTAVLFDERWQEMAWMLAILSVLSIVRPVGRVVHSYMVALGRTRVVMVLEVAKALLLLGCVAALSRFGILAACAGVGVAFAIYAGLGLRAMQTEDGVSAKRLIGGMVGPVLAGGPMIGAVIAARRILTISGWSNGVVGLIAEIVIGAATYIPVALLFAPTTSREFVRLVKVATRRGDDEPASERMPS